MRASKKLRRMMVALVAVVALMPALVGAQGSTPVPMGTSGDTGTDISLITRDPETGKVLPGACYELVGYSNVGCDEDANGTVDFAAIPYLSLIHI